MFSVVIDLCLEVRLRCGPCLILVESFEVISLPEWCVMMTSFGNYKFDFENLKPKVSML